MEKGNYMIEATTSAAQKQYHLSIRKALHFLVPISLCSLLFSCISGFPFSPYNLQYSTIKVSLVAQALDRKCMFLVCNAILVFLAKNLKFSSSTSPGLLQVAEDGVKLIAQLPPISEETAGENVESIENAKCLTTVKDNQTQQEQKQDCDECLDEEIGEQDCEGSGEGSGEMKSGGFVLEGEEWEEDDDEEDNDADTERINSRTEGKEAVEEVNDAAMVSTEELNKKFEEFIRKMKEEIRIEAQQPLIAV